MISPTKFNSIIYALEALYERETDTGAPRSNRALSIKNEEANALLDYLREPYENGYWLLQGDWRNSSPYAFELLGQLNLLDIVNTEADANASAITRKIGEDKRSKFLRITARLSPIFSIFRRIENDSTGKKNPPLSDYDSWIKEIDTEKLREKFPEAFHIYSEKLYFPEIGAGIGDNRFFSFKHGTVAYLHVPRVERALKIASTDRAVLETLRDFYTSLGVIENVSVKRIFSPDDELFSPYFFIVSGLLPRILNDKAMSATFGQALDYYEREDYQHCISNLGLICEDYLHRIYTTLLRSPIVGGLTLGQTIDLLHKNIDALFSSAKPSLRNIDPIYELIKTIDQNSDLNSLKPVLREIASTIKEDGIFYGRKIDDLTKTHARKTPFPARINENLNELLKWRNAASHNTRIPLGAHEADRTLYCLISVVMWWEDKINDLDWSQTKVEILDQLIQDAKF